MTIESSDHSASNRRKRSLEQVSPAAHHCQHRRHHAIEEQAPTPKTSRSDFHLNRMDHRLKWALKTSRDGNVRMMEFYLSQAKVDAIASQTYGITFVQWESWIRGQLQN